MNRASFDYWPHAWDRTPEQGRTSHSVTYEDEYTVRIEAEVSGTVTGRNEADIDKVKILAVNGRPCTNLDDVLKALTETVEDDDRVVEALCESAPTEDIRQQRDCDRYHMLADEGRI